MDYALWVVTVLALLVALKASLMAAAAGRDAEVVSERVDVVEPRCTDALNRSNWAENGAVMSSRRIDALAKALGYKWVPEGKTESRWEKVGKR